RIHGLVRGIHDVHQAQVGTDLELVARGLVDVRRAQHVEALDPRGQRHRPVHHRAGALGGVDDLGSRLIDQFVVKRLQANSNLLVGHVRSSKSEGRSPPCGPAPVVAALSASAEGVLRATTYARTLETTPAPTVRPPSRIANRSPCSIAIGAISCTVIFTLSPGITISVPSGSVTEPVTSVVRK